MGIIKAIGGAVGGGLADSWLEVLEPDTMSQNTVMVSGVPVKGREKRSSNTKGSANMVSNGSVIHVYPNTMMLLVDNGKIVDYSAEPGYYQVYLSSAPSMFNGELKDSIKETFSRIKYGGVPSSSQSVFFINLQEIKAIKFGTPAPINYFDEFYDAELYMGCSGEYSIKITDPLKFFTEVVPHGSSRVEFNDIGEQLRAEFLTALQTSISQMSVDGIRVSHIMSKSLELAKYMEQALDEKWNSLRGMEICSVGIRTLSYDEQSKEILSIRSKGAMLKDADKREGYVQGAIARGLEAAGSNTAGASQAFMGMGMGMQGAGGFMAAASQTNMAQMQQQQAQQQAAPANGWSCSCGQANNTGNFCSGCGSKKPAPAGSWTCSCGQANTGNFCSGCGNKKPDSGEWVCSCGQKNNGNFCAACGSKKA